MNGAKLEVTDLVKSYDGFIAVNGLSFQVGPGEIFGLLGPNGAGKTTTIRIIMDIFKADSGTIRVLGQPPGVSRSRVGYLPEERGLYRNLSVLETLLYLAELKGVPRATARPRALSWLSRVDLADWAGRRVRDLSRGMQQKVQFVAGLIHDPELLILDEPFQGLDPVNVELLKRLIRELQAEGKTIVLSAHEMSLVEQLCDRIVLINGGKAVLYGRLDEIKRRYAPRTVRLRTPAKIESLPGVAGITLHGDVYTVALGETTPQALLTMLVQRDIPMESFEVASMPLEEIFIAVVKETQDNREVGRE
jgi:ABC-2 type transport system ATP-binding protein